MTQLIAQRTSPSSRTSHAASSSSDIEGSVAGDSPSRNRDTIFFGEEADLTLTEAPASSHICKLPSESNIYEGLLFGEAGIKAMLTNLEPTKWVSWRNKFVARLTRAAPFAVKILNSRLTDAAWAACCADPIHGTTWEALDLLVANTVQACIIPDGEHSDLLNLRLSRSKGWSSGRIIFSHIDAMADPSSGAERMRRDKDLAAETYFQSMMSGVKCRV